MYVVSVVEQRRRLQLQLVIVHLTSRLQVVAQLKYALNLCDRTIAQWSTIIPDDGLSRNGMGQPILLVKEREVPVIVRLD